MRRIKHVLLLALALLPTWVSSAELTERQIQLLSNNCLQCHARPNIGAPMMGNPSDWKERIKQSEDQLLLNVVYGVRGMPPMGYCSACSEADFRALIRQMANLPQPAREARK